MNTAFERTVSKDEWLTPKHIIDALAPFDLDPCASKVQPWRTAEKTFTIDDNGLIQPWKGFVWMNPPYGTQTQKWFRRLTEHGNGIALTFARTETRMFFESVWSKASAIFFIKSRLSFCDTAGNAASNSAVAPSFLIAYGDEPKIRLAGSSIEGKFLELCPPPILFRERESGYLDFA